MQTIYAKERFPLTTQKSVFLAGPTPRDRSTSSWRPAAIAHLAARGYDGIVYVPEDRSGAWDPTGYVSQVDWEEAALKRADAIVFWVPRDMATMPALTTNVEWGVWHDSGKVVFGAPEGAPAVRYLQHYAEKTDVPVADSLPDTIDAALRMIGSGALRTEGECQVPLILWRHKTFQSWLCSQYAAGNRLDGCDLLWTFRAGPRRSFTFAWIAHVNVYVSAEDRNKTNEFVFGRTDVAGVVMYRFAPDGDPLDAEVVIVKEFRSPARTVDGCVWELTCGSSKDTDEATMRVALHEVEEEAGVKLEPSRLRRLGERQLAGTLSCHTATLYAVELTSEEMDEVRRTVGAVRGVVEDSERTYAHVLTVRELLASQLVDWSTMGMVLSAIGF